MSGRVIAPALKFPGDADPFAVEGVWRHERLVKLAFDSKRPDGTPFYELGAKEGFLVQEEDQETGEKRVVFMGRFHAAYVARAAGQVEHNVGRLYSEHLWDEDGRALWEE